ncbi:MAG: tetratricopeptide repeat protein, partial [Desulfarculales bacterium]|nr:tetratricopeptide repeat protein [Desulfarculales bacterium]
MDNGKLNCELSLFEAWVAENPSSQFFVELACAYQELNRIPEAIAVMERAMGFHPQHLKARLMLARMYRRTGQEEKARNILIQALSIIARQKQIFYELADLVSGHGPELEDMAQTLDRLARSLSGDELNPAAAFRPIPAYLQSVLERLESL